jgi:hypothetical protein
VVARPTSNVKPSTASARNVSEPAEAKGGKKCVTPLNRPALLAETAKAKERSRPSPVEFPSSVSPIETSDNHSAGRKQAYIAAAMDEQSQDNDAWDTPPILVHGKRASKGIQRESIAFASQDSSSDGSESARPKKKLLKRKKAKKKARTNEDKGEGDKVKRVPQAVVLDADESSDNAEKSSDNDSDIGGTRNRAERRKRAVKGGASIFVEEEASESDHGRSGRSSESENSDEEPDEGNVSGLIDDSSQLSLDSKHPLAHSSGSPLPPSVLHSKMMIESPDGMFRGKLGSKLGSKLENILRMERAFEEDRRQQGLKRQRSRCIRSARMVLEEEEEEDDEESDDDIEDGEEEEEVKCADTPTNLGRKKRARVVLDSDSDSSSPSRSVKKLKGGKDEKQEIEEEEEEKRAESPPRARRMDSEVPDANPNPIMVQQIAKQKVDLTKAKLVIWTEARASSALIKEVATELAKNTPLSPQHQFGLQGAHFALGSRVCALVFSPQELVSLWQRKNGAGELCIDELVVSLASRYPVVVLVVQVSNEQHMADPEFQHAFLYAQEAHSVSTLITDSPAMSARSIIRIAQQEADQQRDLVSLGLAADAQTLVVGHSARVTHFLISNPSISIVAARRLILVQRGKSLADIFALRQKGLTTSVPGLTPAITGLAFAYFQRTFVHNN